MSSWWDKPEPEPIRDACAWLFLVTALLIPGPPRRWALDVLKWRRICRAAMEARGDG